MIQAKELRIGNFLESGDLCFKLMPDHIRDIFEGDNSYQPIQLTPRNLIRFGFEKKEQAGHYVKYILYPINAHPHYLKETQWTSEPFTYNLCTQWVGGEINVSTVFNNYPKYLHELQNLYFALTGKELTVNL